MYNHTSPAYDAASTETIQWYLEDLARMPALSLKAEQEAVQQIAADPLSKEANDARTWLIEANLRLVVRLARRYQPYGPELADLVQEGNLALIKAAQQFDPQRSRAFRSFATQRICWALCCVVEEHLRERHLLEPGMEPIHPLRAQVLKALAHAAIDEEALVLDLPEERFVSLHLLLEEGDTDPILTDDRSSNHTCSSNEPAPDEGYLAQERSILISACLHRLTLMERLVLIHRYFLDREHSLESVGRILSITRGRAQQLEERGLCKLRQARNTNILRGLL